MKLPLILKGHNIFIDGENLHGLVGDIERPKAAPEPERAVIAPPDQPAPDTRRDD